MNPDWVQVTEKNTIYQGNLEYLNKWEYKNRKRLQERGNTLVTKVKFQITLCSCG